MATVLLQARMGSKRLPGKVLKMISGKPMLHYTVEALKLSSVVDKIVLCIPDTKENNILEDFAKDCNINCFRGSEDNVLQRLHYASLEYPDKYFFRATGDNPILDYENPGRILKTIEKYNPYGCQYAYEWGMPKGSTVEVFTTNALYRTYNDTWLRGDAEHVTTYMKRNLNICSLNAPIEYRFPFNFSVDTEEDFRRVSRIIEENYSNIYPIIPIDSEFKEFSIISEHNNLAGIPKFSKIINWYKWVIDERNCLNIAKGKAGEVLRKPNSY